MDNKFIITEKAPEFFISRLTSLGYQVDYKPNIIMEELESIIGNYIGILIRGRIILNKHLIELAGQLKYILRPGSGLDIIDLTAARFKNIHIINSPEGNRDAVAEHAVALLLSLLNNIPKSYNELSEMLWTRKENIGIELGGKTIGIIGFGNTGMAFAQRLKSFNVKILAYDKYKSGFGNTYIKEADQDEIFKQADIVSFHIPLTDETKYIVNEKYLNQFIKPIYLINTSRGKILKTRALINAINSSKVSGAVLDVLENENFNNLNKEEKTDIQDLISTGKVLITPHIAGLTVESENKIFSILLDKLESKDYFI
jgi:D-3-phosphoglycerate dehydrogenase / 2-oxoglutarate reductase